MEKFPCTRCNGSGSVTYQGFTTLNGEVVPDRTNTCSCCNGEGFFPPIDQSGIVQAIVATRGKNKGSIRAAMVSPLRKDGPEAARAYYVWRLARFHGGKDMTMPVAADMVVRGDPFKKELDSLAETCAKAFFGTDLAAALRWAKVFGIL